MDKLVFVKKHTNDELIKYLLQILQLLRKPFLDEKKLKKLLSLFTNAKIQEEVKVIDALSNIQLPPAQKMPTGIYESLLLKIDAEKKSLDEEIRKMGKKASLRYKASQDKFSEKVFW